MSREVTPRNSIIRNGCGLVLYQHCIRIVSVLYQIMSFFWAFQMPNLGGLQVWTTKLIRVSTVSAMYQQCIIPSAVSGKSCGRTLEGCYCLEGCNCELIRVSTVSTMYQLRFVWAETVGALIHVSLCISEYHKTLIRLSMHVPALTVSAPAESGRLVDTMLILVLIQCINTLARYHYWYPLIHAWYLVVTPLLIRIIKICADTYADTHTNT